MTIKDYARSKGVTYEAIRQQIKTYQAELAGHITKHNRTQILDDYAVEFLDSKRAGNPVIIYEQAKDERIEELERQHTADRNTIIALQAELIATQKQLIEAKDNLAQLQLSVKPVKKRWFWWRTNKKESCENNTNT